MSARTLRASIKFEAVRRGSREGVEVDFNSLNPPTIWVEVRPEPGVKPGEPGYVAPRVYRLEVGPKGGLSLT